MYILFLPETEEPLKIWLDFSNENVGVKQRRPFLECMDENAIDMLPHFSVVLSINERIGYQTVRQDFQ